jgi:5-methyltetrahydrofolate--homocysteine methyltransferase
MHEMIQKLIQQSPVLIDGAWGTQLQGLGLASGDCPDQWNLTNPDAVREVARRYVLAGSQIILTNTFRSNRIALQPFGLAEAVSELNRLGVRHSRDAAGDRAHVFASMGPSGKMLLSGEVSPAELSRAFLEQARALAEAGADAIVIETMSDLEEAKIALEAARSTGLAVIVSMVFDSGKDHDRTMMGTSVEEVARFLEAARADAVGANCGLGIEGYVGIGKRLRSATTLPVWIKPNAGLPELIEGRVTYRSTPEAFAGHAVALLEAGIHFLGGCCGTTPLHIEALRPLFLSHQLPSTSDRS